jgi:glycosyltransferase involved in cell wall biosynthesis
VKEKTKVLLVGAAYPGGISAYMRALSCSALAESFEFKLLETSPNITDVGVCKKIICFLRAIIRFAVEISTNRPVIVHAHMSMRGSFWRKALLFSMARLAHVKFILHLHGSEFRSYVDSSSPATRKAISWVICGADTVVVLSESWLHYVSNKFPRANCKVVRNFSPVEYTFSAVPAEEGRQSVVMLGRVGRRKGIYTLIDAVRVLRDSDVSLMVYVGGDGDISEAVEYASASGVGGYFKFLGWIGPEEKADLLRHASMLVLPSFDEGLPLCLLEAMWAGVPIVSTNVGGIPDLITTNLHGVLVNPGKSSELASAMQKILVNRDLGVQFAFNARRNVEANYSREDALSRLIVIYTSEDNADVGGESAAK